MIKNFEFKAHDFEWPCPMGHGWLVVFVCLSVCSSICEFRSVQNFVPAGKENSSVRSGAGSRCSFRVSVFILNSRLKCETEAISSLCAYVSACVSFCN